MDKTELREGIRFIFGQEVAYDDTKFDWFITNKKKLDQLQAENETLKDRQRNAEIGLAEVSALNEKLQAEIKQLRKLLKMESRWKSSKWDGHWIMVRSEGQKLRGREMYWWERMIYFRLKDDKSYKG